MTMKAEQINGMSRDELRKVASGMKIKNYASLRKSELIEAIVANLPKPAEKKAVKKSKKVSTKSKVYAAWKAGQVDVEKLQKIAGESAKIGTIRSWISRWKNGKHIPATC